MTTPTTFTPLAVDPVQLTPTIATLLTAGANGAVLDYIALVNTGLKDFEQVWDRDISVGYNDETADSASVGTADVTIFRTDAQAQADEFIFGMAAKFTAAAFVLSTILAGATVTLEVSYSTGAGTWTVMSNAANNLVDNTNVLKNSGEITWNDPGAGWVSAAVNGVSKFYIRLRLLTANPSTGPVGTQVRCGSQGAVGATVYYVNSGGSVGDGTILAKGISVPGDGVPINLLDMLRGRPWHMEPSSTIRALADQQQVTCHIGGTDYA